MQKMLGACGTAAQFLSGSATCRVDNLSPAIGIMHSLSSMLDDKVLQLAGQRLFLLVSHILCFPLAASARLFRNPACIMCHLASVCKPVLI